jgi:hypothetical protein
VFGNDVVVRQIQRQYGIGPHIWLSLRLLEWKFCPGNHSWGFIVLSSPGLSWPGFGCRSLSAN